MPTQDPDKALARYINGLNRIRHGLERQRSRIDERSATAPRLLEGTEFEVVDLTGDPGNDIDYYAYEVGRLRSLAIEAAKSFDKPSEITEAVAKFDKLIPGAKEFRNPVTHIDDTDRLDDVVWFSAAVRTRADGSVEYLIDPRYQHHDAALELADTLLGYLRDRLQTSIGEASSGT